MKSIRFSTRELAKPRQLEAWREWYADSYEVAPLDEGEQGFAAESEAWKLDGAALARVSAPPLRAERPKSLIKRDPTDHLCIGIGRRALTGLMFDGDWSAVPAGAPFVLSLDDPHVSQRDLDERLQLYIARDQFREVAPALDAARGQAVSTPLGALLAEYIRLLERSLPGLTDEEAQRLPPALVAMVVACVAPSSDRMAVASGQMDVSRKEKVRRFVLRNLCRPDLGPDMLCREMGISRSNLYRILESEGGVAHYIQHHRLTESFARLSDPSNMRPVAAIAEELRLMDPSGFSRAFRRQFGMSPTDVREAARGGAPSPIAWATRGAAPGGGFRGLMGEL